jgi:hypothetical protein
MIPSQAPRHPAAQDGGEFLVEEYMSRVIMAALLAGGLASCAQPGTPVPVLGDTRTLEGKWEGEYKSDATGRFGSILFRLDASADTAQGDVLMIPEFADEGPQQNRLPSETITTRKQPQALAISFVACAEGEVSGKLAPYRDPATGDKVETVFLGRISGNRLEGTFTSYYQDGSRAGGRWWAIRRDP